MSSGSQQSTESGIFSPMRVVSPPRSPTITRRGVQEDGCGQEGSVDSGASPGSLGQGSKSKPELSNIVNLEQALIKTIHGNRKDVLVPPAPATQAGGNMGYADSCGEVMEAVLNDDDDSSGPAATQIVEDDGGRVLTQSKSEPVLHSGQRVVRSRFIVETVPEPVNAGSQCDAGSVGSDSVTASDAPSESPSVESTKITGRFKVTTTRDSKSQSDVSELGTPSKTKHDGEAVTNCTASASALCSPHYTPSVSSANKEEGSHSLSRQPSHVSNSDHHRVLLKFNDPSGRPLNPTIDSQAKQRMSKTASFYIPNSLDSSYWTKQRSASLGQLPPSRCNSSDRLYMYGDGAFANMPRRSQAHAVTQSSQTWPGRFPFPHQADIATQTSPAMHKDRPAFGRLAGVQSLVSTDNVNKSPPVSATVSAPVHIASFVLAFFSSPSSLPTYPWLSPSPHSFQAFWHE